MSLPNPKNQKPIRVLVVDDHSVVRRGTIEILNTGNAFEVVGEAESGEDLEGLLKLKAPDVLLLDINLPGKNGLQLLAELKPKFPDLKIILFSAYTDLPYIRKASDLKAHGFISKMTDDQTLRKLIQSIVQEPEACFLYSHDLQEKVEDLMQNNAGASPLTPREQDTLNYLAEGKTNQQIATALCISVKTVDTHVSNLLKKAKAQSRTQLIAYGLKQGWLTAE